jgi:hypothetical protein
MSNTKVNGYENEILHQVFEKIKKENGGTSINKTAEILEDILLEEFKHQKSARTLVRYYNKYVLNKDETCGVLTFELNNYLAEILEHKDFKTFVGTLKELGPNKNSKNLGGFKPKVKNNQILMAGGTLTIILVFYFFSFNKVASYNNQWMIWNKDHYEIFTNEMKVNNQKPVKLIPYNEMAIKYHKKITIACDTSIKNVWYYKVNNHKLELYNYAGQHPVNGKTLKALTYNMRNKYVCDKEITNN